MDSLINQFNTAYKEEDLKLVKNLIKDFDLDFNKKKIILEILVFIIFV